MLQDLSDPSIEFQDGQIRTHYCFNRRRHKGVGGQSDTPSIFLALNFCSLTDCQKLSYNYFLFVNTSFDLN